MYCVRSLRIGQVIRPILLLASCFAVPLIAAAQVQNYYVSPSGSDSNPGTSTQPWATIAHADATLSLGSGTTSNCGVSWWAGETNVGTCVHLAPGTYSGRITTNKSGTATQRIVYISDTRWAAVIGDGQTSSCGSTCAAHVWHANNSYMTIAGIELTGPHSSSGILFFGSFDHAVFNHVHDILDPAGDSCYAPPGYCMDSNGGSGIATIVGSTSNLVDSNVIHEIGPYAFCQQCTDASVCNGVHGIYAEVSNDVLTNNIIYHAQVNGIETYHTPTNHVVANNLSFSNGCARYGGGIQLANNTSGSNNTNSAINNIVVNNGGWGLDLRGLSSNSILDNNIYFGNAGPACNNCGGPVASGNITSGSTSNLFVNFNANPAVPTISAGKLTWSNADYHLTSGSAAIGAGTTTCASGGISPCVPTLDLDGLTRPSPPSIGTYASPSGLAPPTAPTGLTATVQ